MNKERQEVHLCPAHVTQRGSSIKAWGLWGLFSHHPASARDKVMVRPTSCISCWGHVHRVGTTLTLKHSLCQRLWKVQILPFRFYGWFLCLWSSVPTEDEGKFLLILMGLGCVLVSVFCCCFLCCSRPIPLLKFLPGGKRKATLLNKLWNIYICEANPLCLAPPLILRWHFL